MLVGATSMDFIFLLRGIGSFSFSACSNCAASTGFLSYSTCSCLFFLFYLSFLRLIFNFSNVVVQDFFSFLLFKIYFFFVVQVRFFLAGVLSKIDKSSDLSKLNGIALSFLEYFAKGA